MIIIRYADIYKTIETQEGLVDIVAIKNVTLPIIIEPDNVNLIQPYISSKGKIFKNVSYINYDGEMIKVVGNYKTLDNKLKNYNKNTRLVISGFKRYGNKE